MQFLSVNKYLKSVHDKAELSDSFKSITKTIAVMHSEC